MAVRKSPAERATEEFETAKSAVEKAKARAEKTQADADRAAQDLKRAQHRVTMAGTHPDLPEGLASDETIDAEPTDAAEPADVL